MVFTRYSRVNSLGCELYNVYCVCIYFSCISCRRYLRQSNSAKSRNWIYCPQEHSLRDCSEYVEFNGSLPLQIHDLCCTRWPQLPSPFTLFVAFDKRVILLDGLKRVGRESYDIQISSIHLELYMWLTLPVSYVS